MLASLVAILVSMLTRMARQYSSVDRKQGKIESYCQKKSQTRTRSIEKVLQVTDYDELVYKLTLKYRQKGYDISNSTIPHVKNTCM